MTSENKCIHCKSSFFSEHKNVMIFKEGGHYFHAFHKALKVGYSLFKCIKCKARYIVRKKYDSDIIEKMIPIGEFSLSDASDFLTRSKLIYPKYLHLDMNFASEMVYEEV